MARCFAGGGPWGLADAGRDVLGVVCIDVLANLRQDDRPRALHLPTMDLPTMDLRSENRCDQTWIIWIFYGSTW